MRSIVDALAEAIVVGPYGGHLCFAGGPVGVECRTICRPCRPIRNKMALDTFLAMRNGGTSDVA